MSSKEYTKPKEALQNIHQKKIASQTKKKLTNT